MRLYENYYVKEKQINQHTRKQPVNQTNIINQLNIIKMKTKEFSIKIKDVQSEKKLLKIDPQTMKEGTEKYLKNRLFDMFLDEVNYFQIQERENTIAEFNDNKANLSDIEALPKNKKLIKKEFKKPLNRRELKAQRFKELQEKRYSK